MMRGTTVLAVLALLVVACQMKTLLVKTKSKGGDDYSSQINTGSVGGNMNQRGGFGKSQTNHGSVVGNMNQDFSIQTNTGSVGGNMNQRGGSGNSQRNHGWA